MGLFSRQIGILSSQFYRLSRPVMRIAFISSCHAMPYHISYHIFLFCHHMGEEDCVIFMFSFYICQCLANCCCSFGFIAVQYVLVFILSMLNLCWMFLVVMYYSILLFFIIRHMFSHYSEQDTSANFVITYHNCILITSLLCFNESHILEENYSTDR
jgi:hypothetical protein